MFNKENLENFREKKISAKNLSSKNKVDINILLNRVRADKKREKIESVIFIGIISLSVIVTGLILSFR
tara:strand:- start:13295 stop:13498 length:204 start_codon:yes stop_codon:yes gene_type:complete